MTTPGYGFAEAKSPPGERMPWSRVLDLLEMARKYWICTTRPDGRPHAAPVWGLWIDGAFYFSVGEDSVKARNFRANPAVSVHPECPGDEAVILEGSVKKISSPAKLKPAWKAYKAKYDWDVEGYPFYALRPRVVYSFKEDLAETATRWLFAGGGRRKRG